MHPGRLQAHPVYSVRPRTVEKNSQHPTRMTHPLISLEPELALSDLLQSLADRTDSERVSIQDLLHALGDRALGALIFLFAFPNVLPLPPGTSFILGAPLVFLVAQLMMARPPWLPHFIGKRAMARADFAQLVARIVPWLVRAEKLLRPRLQALTSGVMERVLGALCLLLATLVVLPIPFGNMLPALAISVIALGLLESDGIWVLIGLAVSAVAAVVVSSVVAGLAKAAFYVVARWLQ